MTADEKTIRIPADLQAVSTACDFVAEVAAAAGMNDKQAHHCQLAVDEACTNIIEHGYQANNHGQFIDVGCLVLPDRLVIRIADDSPAYNPLQRTDPKPEDLLEDRVHGGWGVFFIKQVMDNVTYQYQGGRNQLKMSKYFNPQSAKLNLTTKNYPGKILLVSVQGKIGDENQQKLESALSEYLQAGNKHLILDMQSVPAVSSTGWQTLIGLTQRARSQRGDLVLVNLTAPAREMIKLTGLDMVFTVAESVEAALKHYPSKK